MIAGSIPARSMAAFMTADDRSTGCTPASAPSALPRATALRAALTITTSVISISPAARSIAQRLAGLEGVRDALLRLLGAEEAEELFALEVEQILLGDVTRGAVAAA